MVIKSHLYNRIKEDLKLQILKGSYKEGDLLPSENDLCSSYSITRSTARQALNELVNEGYVQRRHGKGSIVINKRRSLGLLTVKGFTREVSGTHEKTKSVILEKPKPGKWADDFFYPISAAEKQAGCISFKRIRFVNENPVMLEQTFIPNINIPKFCQNSFVNESLFDTLSYNYNIEIKSIEQDMRAVASDASVARSFRIRKGAPLLQVYIKYLTSRNNFFIYSLLFCNTEKYSIGNLL